MTTTADATDALTAYQWEPQPKAAAFVQKVVDEFLEKLPEAKAFADRLYRETGNRFIDLVKEISLPDHLSDASELQALGWRPASDGQHLVSTTGMFPVLYPNVGYLDIRIEAENVVDFITANDISPAVYAPLADVGECIYRDAQVIDEGHSSLTVFESCGGLPFNQSPKHVDLATRATVLESFRLRLRNDAVDQSDTLFTGLSALIDEAIRAVGRDVACDLFFAAEREYWQRRNTAAQFQKARQDKLGIGWANHDHHTYRSSRRHFHKLVGLWEKLGFECRERFYPGPEAGWGAQVMEQPVCGIVTFNDVDISEDEMLTDFAHEPMEDRTADNGGLATVGLWCGLHGESVLQAGMHHLECTFDFAALEEQMKTEAGIETMPKFTDFPHLKQAFTKGERWQVDPKRIDALLDKKLITEHQAKEFRKNGAIGSHLENLERNDGFKGFNQTGVTDIIKRTDPRYAETR